MFVCGYDARVLPKAIGFLTSLAILVVACEDSKADRCALGPDESQPSPGRLCGTATPAAGSACDPCAGRCSFADGKLSEDTTPPQGGAVKPACGSDGTVTQATCTDRGWALAPSQDCHATTPPPPRDAGGD
jgi:hypothetical protein